MLVETVHGQDWRPLIRGSDDESGCVCLCCFSTSFLSCCSSPGITSWHSELWPSISMAPGHQGAYFFASSNQVLGLTAAQHGAGELALVGDSSQMPAVGSTSRAWACWVVFPPSPQCHRVCRHMKLVADTYHHHLRGPVGWALLCGHLDFNFSVCPGLTDSSLEGHMFSLCG